MFNSAAKVNLLRAFDALWVALSVPLAYMFSAGVVGYTSHWENGKGYVAAGSHPVLLAWSIIALAVLAILFKMEVEEFPAGVPGMWRRFFAFLIDFWFIVAVLASIGGTIPLWLERMRTGQFSWQFQRNYSVPSDQIFVLPLALIIMALMFLYFVWPLTKGKQTVGCFILRLRVAPPFGSKGALTFRTAARRVWLEFTGMGSLLFKRNDRDSQGRTWYDRESDCIVILIKYE
jgi:uncharacterized RDD family membrane protein YckC